MSEHWFSRPGASPETASAAVSENPAPVARQPVRTPGELAESIAVPVGQAESILRGFGRAGLVEAVEPGRYVLTEHGRAVAVGFAAAGEEGFRGTE